VEVYWLQKPLEAANSFNIPGRLRDFARATPMFREREHCSGFFKTVPGEEEDILALADAARKSRSPEESFGWQLPASIFSTFPPDVPACDHAS